VIKDIITIEVDGIHYDGWKDVTVTKSIEDFCGSFSFTATQVDMSKEFPIQRRKLCRIYINGVKVISGRVEKISPSHSAKDHIISISGRDLTCDIVDSRIHDISIKPPISLENIVHRVLDRLNITGIKVINPYKLDPITEQIATPVQISAAEFLHNYAQKRQVLLTTNTDGDIEFVRASTIVWDTVLSKSNKDAPSIISGSAVYDDSKRFHTYELVDQENVASNIGQDEFDMVKGVAIKATAVDNEIPNTRIYSFTSSDCSSGSEDPSARVKWEANFRRAHSFSYTTVVSGFKPRNDLGIWFPNILVRVYDPFCYVDSTLLVTNVVYTQDSSGTKVELRMLTRDAFTLEVEKDTKHKKHQKEGDITKWDVTK